LDNANLSILKKFSCDLDKFTLIYGLFPSDAFTGNAKAGAGNNLLTLPAFDIYKREVFDLFKVVHIELIVSFRRVCMFISPLVLQVAFRFLFQLLGELLLDRYNFSVMTKYITNTDNLKQQMNLLKEKSKNIQFEAFHVFKVFCVHFSLT
jgi:hypothetical protein